MYASGNITIGTTCHIPNVSCEYLPMSSKLLHVHEEASAMSDELIGIHMAESTHTVISYSFIYIISAYVYIVVFVVELIAVLMSTRLGRRRHVVPHRNNLYIYIYIHGSKLRLKELFGDWIMRFNLCLHFSCSFSFQTLVIRSVCADRYMSCGTS